VIPPLAESTGKTGVVGAGPEDRPRLVVVLPETGALGHAARRAWTGHLSILKNFSIESPLQQQPVGGELTLRRMEGPGGRQLRGDPVETVERFQQGGSGP
jgi:hypothetical protein